MLTNSDGDPFTITDVFPVDGSFTVQDRKGKVSIQWETDKLTDTTLHVLLAYSVPLIWFGRNHRLAKIVESILTYTLLHTVEAKGAGAADKTAIQ